MKPCHGAEGRDRTADTGFFRPVLYQLSYLGPGTSEIASRTLVRPTEPEYAV